MLQLLRNVFKGAALSDHLGGSRAMVLTVHAEGDWAQVIKRSCLKKPDRQELESKQEEREERL